MKSRCLLEGLIEKESAFFRKMQNHTETRCTYIITMTAATEAIMVIQQQTSKISVPLANKKATALASMLVLANAVALNETNRT